MANVATEDLRNVALLSHSGAGKTMLAEAMFYAAGGTNRLGSTSDGTTISDYEPEEHKRTASVQTSVLPCSWRDHKINVLDTPGYADFRGEVISAVRVVEAAVIVVAAPSGVEVGTRQMWQMAEERSLPRIVFVNKLDRENADFERVMESLDEAFGRRCVPLQVPIGSESSFSGPVSLLDEGAEVPDGLQDTVETARERLIEAIAETDDDLTTKYLEGEPLTKEEITAGVKLGVASGDLVPVLVGAATEETGVKELLGLIVDLLPSPAAAGDVQATILTSNEEVSVTADPTAPLAALVFKTAADPFVGKLSYFRVYSGDFKSDSQVWNVGKQEAERVAQLFVVSGKTQEAVDQLAPGDIGAAAKLNSVVTGDTLAAREDPLQLPEFHFPEPVYQMAVFPKSKADLDKMTTAVSRIAEEDPTLQVTREPDTLEMLLGGLGDTHVEVAVEKMKRKFGVEIELQTPKVAYKETIGGSAKVEYRHKKQTGGHGQFAHVWLEIEPLPRGSGFDFQQKVVGGSVPREYIPSVEKGCQKALTDGVIAGFPIVDLRATLFDGSFHPVDSSGVSFEIAGGHALADGIKQADPVLLEPVMQASITVPDSDTGDVMGDLNGRRSRIQGMNPNGDGTTSIEAEVPKSEMLRYATELRSQTQGRGSFTMKFDHYEAVPSHIAQRIADQHNGDEEKA